MSNRALVLFLMFLMGLALIVIPFVPSVQEHYAVFNNWMVQTVSFVTGVCICVVVTGVILILNVYRRASANQAFVQTGMGGAKVILDRGSLVLPVVHEIIPVSLETMRLNVERRGEHALITKDNLRVDLSAEFYIKVQANKEDILQAARSLGGRSVEARAVSELVQEKLVSALRTVAATKDLVELHAKRDEFASAVQQIVTHDLASNGLTLESVTISALDQTDSSSLQEFNVFDAQGLRKIAEITQRARVERNLIEQQSEREIVQTNVENRKQVLDQERQEREFAAEQRARVANYEAEREREIQEFKIQQDEAVARREITKHQSVEVAEVERKLAVEQAEVDMQIALVEKAKEQETADISRQQAVEVASWGRQVAVAHKEEEHAKARETMLQAAAEAERADQQVLTVQVTKEAEREASKKLIAAKQVIEEDKIREQTHADVAAYTQLKEAEARQQAADLDYQATLRLAEGDAAAASRRAEGEKAERMVEIEIERERVRIEGERVELERVSLKNKSDYEHAALEFELEKQRIDSDRDVRINTAQSLGQMLANAQVQVYGDPETMGRMTDHFMKAAGISARLDGLLSSLPPEAHELLNQLGTRLNSVIENAQQQDGSTTSGSTASGSTQEANGIATSSGRSGDSQNTAEAGGPSQADGPRSASSADQAGTTSSQASETRQGSSEAKDQSEKSNRRSRSSGRRKSD